MMVGPLSDRWGLRAREGLDHEVDDAMMGEEGDITGGNVDSTTLIVLHCEPG